MLDAVCAVGYRQRSVLRMAEEPEKKDEFELTGEGEALGYIGMDQAQVRAMQVATETPGDYGPAYSGIPMAFEAINALETEDHYVITLSLRPQGDFSGRPGQEQFFIEKEGSVAHRQVLALPRPGRRFPLIPVALGLVVAGIAAVIAVMVVTSGGGDEQAGAVAVTAPTAGPQPSSAPVEGIQTPTPGLTMEPTPGPTTGRATLLPPSASGGSNSPATPTLEPQASGAGLTYLPEFHSGGLEVLARQSVAQSFTIPSDGVITGVEIVGIGIGTCPVPEDLSFRLLATVDGFPGMPSFYSVALPHEDFVEGFDNLKIDFSEGVSVGAFQTLALELSNAADPTAGGNCFYGWDGDSPGAYQGGQAFASPDNGRTWLPGPNDLGFRVFFEAEAEGPAVPTPRLTPSPATTPVPTATPMPTPTPTPLPTTAPPSPAGKIAFSSNRDGNFEIYAMDADGSKQTRLTFNGDKDLAPAWSHDGASIAFHSDRAGNWEIYTMNTDGANQTRLTFTNRADQDPAWSPDGSSIAFFSERDGAGVPVIYTMNPDGSGQTRLTLNEYLNWHPAWSPDGTRIAFTSIRGVDWDGKSEIYTMNADGSNQTRLTFSNSENGEPTWSPDDAHITFYSKRDGKSEIYTMNADGSNQTRLTKNEAGDYGPTWSPAGVRIAFESDRDGNREIYTMNADGSNQARLTFNEAGDRKPAWSP